jgi:transposase-like protein
MNNKPEYKQVTNIPIGCTFCGSTVHGKVVGEQVRWVCPRCSNLVKVGKSS